MDYDGLQPAATHSRDRSLFSRISPDGSRVAFSALTKTGWTSLCTLWISTVWSASLASAAQSSSRVARMERSSPVSSSAAGILQIYVCDATAPNLTCMTSGKGPDVLRLEPAKPAPDRFSISGSTGLPQVYTMKARRHQPAAYDRSGLRRLPQTGPPNGPVPHLAWIASTAPVSPAL